MALLTNAPLEQKWLEAIPQETWEAIINDAIVQRVAPILFHRLKHSTHRLQIPSHLHQRLHQRIIQLAAWNLVLTDELLRILTACRLQNIECIPIRGPVLATQLYGPDAVRQMDDLDLLVHQEDLSAVKELFDRLGYAAQEQRQGFLETFSYSLEFSHPQHGVIVEPRWTLADPPFLSTATMEPVWARIERCRIRDRETATLSRADLLLHLCLHLLHKGMHAPLLWYYELDRLIRLGGDSLSWEVVIAQAREMDQAGLIAEVLTTVVHRFYSPVSESNLKDLLEPSAGTASRSPQPMSEQLLTHSSLHGREEFAVLCSLRGLRPKIHYAAALLFPSPSYMAQRYGLSGFRKLLIAYFLRACHLFGNGCRWAIAWIRAALSPRQG